MQSAKGKVFLSHTSSNVDKIKEFAHLFESNDIPTWYAPRDIPAGETYYEQIIHAIENDIEIMLVYMTEDIQQSDNVKKEIASAHNYGKKIIPVVDTKISAPKNIEYFVSDPQWIELDQVGPDGLLISVIEAYQNHTSGKTSLDLIVPKPVLKKELSAGIVYEVSEKQKKLTQDVFIPGNGYQEAFKFIEEFGVAVLHHPLNTGKYSAAINLLVEKKMKTIFELSPEITMYELFEIPILPKTGYVLQADLSMTGWTTNQPAWERYAQKLIDQGSALCIVTPNKPKFKELDPYAVRLDKPDKTIEVIKAHYKRNYKIELPSDKLEILDKHLPDTLYPQEAVNLVNRVNQFIENELPLEQLLGSIDSVSKKRVEAWFESDKTIREIAMLMSISIFEGEPIDLILEKRNTIEDLINQDNETRFLNETNIEEYLQRFHAFEKKVKIVMDYGQDSHTGVFLQYNEDHKSIWKYLWRHLDTGQKKKITDFLLNSLEHKKVKKNILFIFTTLAIESFPFVRKNVLHPLLDSSDSSKRILAIEVINQYMVITGNYTRIWNLTKSWAGSHNYSLKWSVLTLIRGPLGKINFEESFILLQKILESEPKLINLVLECLIQLSEYTKESEEINQIFFEKSIKWIEEANQRNNLEVFLSLYDKLIIRHPKLFFSSVKQYQNDLWFPLFDQMYSTQTSDLLIRRLFGEVYEDDFKLESLKDFINYFKENATDTSRRRMGLHLKERNLLSVID